jgi:hypothetical protein
MSPLLFPPSSSPPLSSSLSRPSTDHSHSVLIFIITILLLAADFYYLKNIAGRRLVGLRWWNEVDPQTGDSQWVFESSEEGTKIVNATDSRFFWMAMYAHPCLWVALMVFAFVRLQFAWLTLVGEFWFLVPSCREFGNGEIGGRVRKTLSRLVVTGMGMKMRMGRHRAKFG